jgi:hypothetical protein
MPEKAYNIIHCSKAMQYHIQSESEYIAFCLKLIEQRCEWGPIINWRNRNFQELSLRLSLKSNIQISPGTLKRVFGKVKTHYAYEPQQATKDALAIFLNYENWADFKSQNKLEFPEKLPLMPVNDKGDDLTYRKGIKPWPKSKTVLFGIIVAVGAVVALIFWGISNTETGQVGFFGSNLIGKAYHTSYFHFNIPYGKAQYILDTGDGKMNPVQPGASTVSHYYMLPEHYRVRLFRDLKVVGDTTVYLATRDWEAYVNELSENPRYYPVKESLFLSRGSMRTTPAVIHASGIDTIQIYWVHFVNMQNFDCDGDKFSVVTTLKNQDDIVAVRCNHIKLDVIGENGRISVYFVKKGCEQWVDLIFSEVRIRGSDNELTMFGQDFSDWQEVKVSSDGRQVTVFYRDELIFEADYQNPLGKIIGIKYSFTGSGAVQKIQLTDLNNNQVSYEQDFRDYSGGYE